jgi:hydrogenase small subunit
MKDFSRREFLKLGGGLAVLLGLEATAGPVLARALEKMAVAAPPVLWLQGQSCSGCSVSLLNSETPDPADILTRYIRLWFHSTLSATSGHQAMEVIQKSLDTGGYYLVIEGSIPVGMEKACVVGHQTMVEQTARAAASAKAVIALGSCASFGGIPAAEHNPTGAVSVPDFLKSRGVKTPVIRLPGCPTHPDWLVGTLSHVIGFGLPAMDDLGRPKVFYGKVLHDQCPRFADYEREHFAKTFTDEGCLFKLGCQGPITHADCTLRLWNRGTNSCIQAGAPCIGCASEQFARSASFPFYRKA